MNASQWARRPSTLTAPTGSQKTCAAFHTFFLPFLSHALEHTFLHCRQHHVCFGTYTINVACQGRLALCLWGMHGGRELMHGACGAGHMAWEGAHAVL